MISLSQVIHEITPLFFYESISYLLNAPQKAQENFIGEIYGIYRLQVLSKLIDHLEHYKNDNDIESLRKKLTFSLQEIWDLTIVSKLFYTAMPRDEITLLCAVIAEWLADFPDENRPAISFLMPEVQIISYKDGVPDLSEIPLDILLTTHILGREGKYLIPINRIFDLQSAKNPHDKKSDKWANHYFNYKKHPAEYAYFSSDEYERLVEYSLSIQLFVDAEIDYEKALLSKNSLYSLLDELCSKLYFSSTDGLGQEKNADDRIYAAIKNFHDHYSKFPKDLLKKVPQDLLDDIQKLIDTCSILEKNWDAEKNTVRIETCIQNQRAYIDRDRRKHAVLLSSITIQEEQYNVIIQEKENAKNESAKYLIKMLAEKKDLMGEDKLGLSIPLLTKLNFTNIISKDAADYDFMKFLELTPQEITVLCSDKNIQQQIWSFLKNVHDVYLVITTAKLRSLEALFSVMGEEIALYTMKNYLEKINLLQNIPAERCEIVCKTMKKSFSQLTCTQQYLARNLRKLPRENGWHLIETFKDSIPFITIPSIFLTIIKHIDDVEHLKIICQKARFKKIFLENDDFTFVMKAILLEERLRTVMPFISSCFLNYLPIDDFISLFSSFDSHEKNILYPYLEEKIIKSLKNMHKINRIIAVFPEQKDNIYKKIEIGLADKIYNLTTLEIALHLFHGQENFLQLIQHKLENIIKSNPSDFINISKFIHEKQFDFLPKSLVQRTLKQAKNIRQIEAILYNCPDEKKGDFIQTIHPRILLNIIKLSNQNVDNPVLLTKILDASFFNAAEVPTYFSILFTFNDIKNLLQFLSSMDTEKRKKCITFVKDDFFHLVHDKKLNPVSDLTFIQLNFLEKGQKNLLQHAYFNFFIAQIKGRNVIRYKQLSPLTFTCDAFFNNRISIEEFYSTSKKRLGALKKKKNHSAIKNLEKNWLACIEVLKNQETPKISLKHFSFFESEVLQDHLENHAPLKRSLSFG